MTQTRIRWNPEEKTLVATEILRLRAEDPNMAMVVALRAGQAVLPPARQREIKAWSQLEPTLQPVLDELTLQDSLTAKHSSLTLPSASLQAAPAVSSATDSSPPAELAPAPGEPAVSSTEDIALPCPTPVLADSAPPEPLVAPTGPCSSALDLLQTESVLLAAFQSPVVELALVDLFSRAMAGALKRLSAETPEPPQATSLRSNALAPELVRVLVAGFAGPELKRLADSLNDQYEVRSWSPMQGPQLFETLANICSVAVIPQEFGDEIGEALDRFKLKVLRHEGNPTRLQERLDELLGIEGT